MLKNMLKNSILNISSNTKIYIPVTPSVSTGGPEAIFRLLSYLINKRGLNCFVYFYPNTYLVDPVHPEYKKFNVPIATTIEDIEDNILIVPEFYNHLSLHLKFSKIQKCIWWLSIDFFLIGLYEATHSRFMFRLLHLYINTKNYLNKFFPQLIDHTDLAYQCLNRMKKFKFSSDLLFKNVSVHFCQSAYAFNFLKEKSVTNICYLTDMFDDKLLNIQFDIKSKRNIVAFNPSKGMPFTQHILKNGITNIEFVPIVNMTKTQVDELLNISKVYIDFGNHPGRDRLPREAALNGCCIITCMRGSSGFYEDVPIMDKYKFDDNISNVPKIVNLINNIFMEFESSLSDFENYRSFCKEINFRSSLEIDEIFKLS